MRVTAVERHKRRRLVDVFVDGAHALTLHADLAHEHDLRPGRDVTPRDVRALEAVEARRSALEAALRLLAYRPRSVRELRERLARRGVRRTVIDETVRRLRELGYLDDVAFARFWTETRQTFRPRSRRLMAGELRRRGVASEVAEDATEGIEDEAAAYEAAQRRLRRAGAPDEAYRSLRERLGRFLTQRGFSYEVARRVIDRCWDEREEGTSNET